MDDGLSDATASAPAFRITASGRVSLSREQDAENEDLAATAARQIIARSRAAYAACTTYEDQGTVDIASRGKHPHLEQIVFRTVFAGPQAVRIANRELPGEFNGEMLTQVIVNDAGAESVGPFSDKPDNLENLEGAMSAMGGVSGGLTTDILPLLSNGPHEDDTWFDVPSPEL